MFIVKHGRQLCTCGSGQQRWPLEDAAGIFLTYVCQKCLAEKRAGFNPAVFDSDSDYAVSGEEQDIGHKRGES